MRALSIAALDKPVSVIGMGTMIFHPDSQARDSEGHGFSEMVIGHWLAARPDLRDDRPRLEGINPGSSTTLYPGGADTRPY